MFIEKLLCTIYYTMVKVKTTRFCPSNYGVQLGIYNLKKQKHLKIQNIIQPIEEKSQVTLYV